LAGDGRDGREWGGEEEEEMMKIGKYKEMKDENLNPKEGNPWICKNQRR